VKKNHIVAPQEQLRLEFKNQSVLNTNLDKLSSINLDNSNLDFNLSNSLFNKDSFYFFNNDPLVNYTSNLNLKKSL
jgi:hypothetical protein